LFISRMAVPVLYYVLRSGGSGDRNGVGTV